jgi:hypothetical protein
LIIEEIIGLEDTYHSHNGKYLQVLRNNVLPHYESGSVAEKLGKNIAPDAHVDVYDGPNGKGCVVYYEETTASSTAFYHVGYGPDAVAWTQEPRTVSITAVAA